MKKIKRAIFKTCQRLYWGGLLPWKLWSPIYDRLHRV